MADTQKTDTQAAAKVDPEVARLREENAALREQLAARPESSNARPAPTEPSFGLSEGQRAELETDGRTVSPFTGKMQVGDGQPGGDVRVVDEQEYLKAGRKD